MKLPGTHKHARIVVGLHNTPAYRSNFDVTFGKARKLGQLDPVCGALRAAREGLVPCTLPKGHGGGHVWADACPACGAPKAVSAALCAECAQLAEVRG